MTTMLDDKYPVGLLTDADIKSALRLLFSDNADVSRAKYATYEITLDKGFEVIEYSDTGEIERRSRSPVDGKITVLPGETVLVYSSEVFSLPRNVYARVNTVGQIFLAGFSAENTYVDPGFCGQISITLINNSNRILSMEEGCPLARVEFIKLAKIPEKTHSGRSGVRKSRVVPSIDVKSTEVYRAIGLPELIKQVEASISLDAIQKKSIRSDIALTRAYEELARELKASREQLAEHDAEFKRQESTVKGSQRLAAFSLATAFALWLDKLGVTQGVVALLVEIFGKGDKPTYWLNIVVNISCSVVATPIFNKLLELYKNARAKEKEVQGLVSAK